MALSRRQRAALVAIVDTFAPGLDGLPAASEVGVADRIAETIGSHPRRAEREQLLRLLSAWELVARPGRRFSSLDQEEREAVLRSWRDSGIAARRSAYKAFRKGALHHYLASDSPVRAAIGYPGPPDLEPLPPSVETHSAPVGELSCDVCVVGSGAGGGVAAGVLAAAGLDVVVLEAGPTAEYRREESDAFHDLFLEGGASATDDQSLDFMMGACVGGGTTVNWTTSLRPPDDVLDEWAEAGIDRAQLERSVDAVWSALDVNEEHGRASLRDAALERGCEALGWHVAAQPRNVRGCEQGRVCGTCWFACPLRAKRDAGEAYLAGSGARVYAGVRAERVLVERGAAVGVEAGDLRVRARAVVAACGAFHTPALLRRSGLANVNVGKHLRFHPVTGLIGDFDEEVRPWEGPLQARYSEEHARLDGAHGVRYETAPLHPGLLGAALQWDGARRTFELARRLPHFAPLFAIVRERGSGEVVVDRAGEPSARYRLSPYDLRHVRAGFAGLARILEAAGARRVISAHASPIVWEPGRSSADGFLAQADARGWGPNRVLYVSAHVMGSARMGASPATSACDPLGETWEVANLVVADGSTLPTPSGVNPMISIAALAHMNASALAARLA